jgi:hypothetical protein
MYTIVSYYIAITKTKNSSLSGLFPTLHPTLSKLPHFPSGAPNNQRNSMVLVGGSFVPLTAAETATQCRAGLGSTSFSINNGNKTCIMCDTHISITSHYSSICRYHHVSRKYSQCNQCQLYEDCFSGFIFPFSLLVALDVVYNGNADLGSRGVAVAPVTQQQTINICLGISLRVTKPTFVEYL